MVVKVGLGIVRCALGENSFEMWCYRMILGIGWGWRDRVSDKKVMKRVQTELQTELHFTRDLIKRKMEYAGHVLRGSGGLSHLHILEGKVEGRDRVDRKSVV